MLSQKDPNHPNVGKYGMYMECICLFRVPGSDEDHGLTHPSSSEGLTAERIAFSTESKSMQMATG